MKPKLYSNKITGQEVWAFPSGRRLPFGAESNFVISVYSRVGQHIADLDYDSFVLEYQEVENKNVV